MLKTNSRSWVVGLVSLGFALGLSQSSGAALPHKDSALARCPGMLNIQDPNNLLDRLDELLVVPAFEKSFVAGDRAEHYVEMDTAASWGKARYLVSTERVAAVGKTSVQLSVDSEAASESETKEAAKRTDEGYVVLAASHPATSAHTITARHFAQCGKVRFVSELKSHAGPLKSSFVLNRVEPSKLEVESGTIDAVNVYLTQTSISNRQKLNFNVKVVLASNVPYLAQVVEVVSVPDTDEKRKTLFPPWSFHSGHENIVFDATEKTRGLTGF